MASFPSSSVSTYTSVIAILLSTTLFQQTVADVASEIPSDMPSFVPSGMPVDVSEIPSDMPSNAPTDSSLADGVPVSVIKCQDFAGETQAIYGSSEFAGGMMTGVDFLSSDFSDTDGIIRQMNIHVEWTQAEDGETCDSTTLTRDNAYSGDVSFALVLDGTTTVDLEDATTISNLFLHKASSTGSGLFEPERGSVDGSMAVQGMNAAGTTWNLMTTFVQGSSPACVYEYCVEVTTTCTEEPCPSSVPSMAPSSSTLPSANPSTAPSASPSGSPSRAPSASPSSTPSNSPSASPSDIPSSSPSVEPSESPSAQPSAEPSDSPSVEPSAYPSAHPSEDPSAVPSIMPSSIPSGSPSINPSASPTSMPSTVPTKSPTTQPSAVPTSMPSTNPSDTPSSRPTLAPVLPPLSVQRTSAASAEIMMKGVTRNIPANKQDRTIKLFCDILAKRMTNPEGLAATTCQWRGQYTHRENIVMKVDVTFYYKCTSVAAGGGQAICPFETSYPTPQEYLDAFFSIKKNKKILKNAWKNKITRLSSITNTFPRSLGTGRVNFCSKQKKRSDCRSKSACEWVSDIKFCLPVSG